MIKLCTYVADGISGWVQGILLAVFLFGLIVGSLEAAAQFGQTVFSISQNWPEPWQGVWPLLAILICLGGDLLGFCVGVAWIARVAAKRAELI